MKPRSDGTRSAKIGVSVATQKGTNIIYSNFFKKNIVCNVISEATISLIMGVLRNIRCVGSHECAVAKEKETKRYLKMCFIIDVDQEVLVCYFYLHRVMNFRKKKYQAKGDTAGSLSLRTEIAKPTINSI